MKTRSSNRGPRKRNQIVGGSNDKASRHLLSLSQLDLLPERTLSLDTIGGNKSGGSVGADSKLELEVDLTHNLPSKEQLRRPREDKIQNLDSTLVVSQAVPCRSNSRQSKRGSKNIGNTDSCPDSSEVNVNCSDLNESGAVSFSSSRTAGAPVVRGKARVVKRPRKRYQPERRTLASPSRPSEISNNSDNDKENDDLILKPGASPVVTETAKEEQHQDKEFPIQTDGQLLLWQRDRRAVSTGGGAVPAPSFNLSSIAGENDTNGPGDNNIVMSTMLLQRRSLQVDVVVSKPASALNDFEPSDGDSGTKVADSSQKCDAKSKATELFSAESAAKTGRYSQQSRCINKRSKSLSVSQEDDPASAIVSCSSAIAGLSLSSSDFTLKPRSIVAAAPRPAAACRSSNRSCFLFDQRERSRRLAAERNCLLKSCLIRNSLSADRGLASSFGGVTTRKRSSSKPRQMSGNYSNRVTGCSNSVTESSSADIKSEISDPCHSILSHTCEELQLPSAGSQLGNAKRLSLQAEVSRYSGAIRPSLQAERTLVGSVNRSSLQETSHHRDLSRQSVERQSLQPEKSELRDAELRDAERQSLQQEKSELRDAKRQSLQQEKSELRDAERQSLQQETSELRDAERISLQPDVSLHDAEEISLQPRASAERCSLQPDVNLRDAEELSLQPDVSFRDAEGLSLHPEKSELHDNERHILKPKRSELRDVERSILQPDVSLHDAEELSLQPEASKLRDAVRSRLQPEMFEPRNSERRSLQHEKAKLRCATGSSAHLQPVKSDLSTPPSLKPVILTPRDGSRLSLQPDQSQLCYSELLSLQPDRSFLSDASVRSVPEGSLICDSTRLSLQAERFAPCNEAKETEQQEIYEIQDAERLSVKAEEQQRSKLNNQNRSNVQPSIAKQSSSASKIPNLSSSSSRTSKEHSSRRLVRSAKSAKYSVAAALSQLGDDHQSLNLQQQASSSCDILSRHSAAIQSPGLAKNKASDSVETRESRPSIHEERSELRNKSTPTIQQSKYAEATYDVVHCPSFTSRISGGKHPSTASLGSVRRVKSAFAASSQLVENETLPHFSLDNHRNASVDDCQQHCRSANPSNKNNKELQFAELVQSNSACCFNAVSFAHSVSPHPALSPVDCPPLPLATVRSGSTTGYATASPDACKPTPAASIANSQCQLVRLLNSDAAIQCNGVSLACNEQWETNPTSASNLYSTEYELSVNDSIIRKQYIDSVHPSNLYATVSETTLDDSSIRRELLPSVVRQKRTDRSSSQANKQTYLTEAEFTVDDSQIRCHYLSSWRESNMFVTVESDTTENRSSIRQLYLPSIRRLDTSAPSSSLVDVGNEGSEAASLPDAATHTQSVASPSNSQRLDEDVADFSVVDQQSMMNRLEISSPTHHQDGDAATNEQSIAFPSPIVCRDEGVANCSVPSPKHDVDEADAVRAESFVPVEDYPVAVDLSKCASILNAAALMDEENVEDENDLELTTTYFYDPHNFLSKEAKAHAVSLLPNLLPLDCFCFFSVENDLEFDLTVLKQVRLLTNQLDEYRLESVNQLSATNLPSETGPVRRSQRLLNNPPVARPSDCVRVFGYAKHPIRMMDRVLVGFLEPREHAKLKRLLKRQK